jgi:anti-repressor protein
MMDVEKSLQVFSFEGRRTRIVEKDGAPWWVAKDVCDVLGIEKYRDAVARLDEDEREPVKVDTPGGIQTMTGINESGLWKLILRSNKPEAKRFRKFVTSEVLPAIRAHGFYATPQRLAELEAELAATRAKVLFADAYAASGASLTIGACSKLLRQGGQKMGRNRFCRWLREGGYFLSGRGHQNEPSQLAMELGLFEVQATVITRPDGHAHPTKSTRVAAKGVIYFASKLLGVARKAIATKAATNQLLLPGLES